MLAFGLTTAVSHSSPADSSSSARITHNNTPNNREKEAHMGKGPRKQANKPPPPPDLDLIDEAYFEVQYFIFLCLFFA